MNALSLINCASEINAAHQQAIQHADRAIEFARQAGDLLLKVKSDLPHGEFLPWVEQHCTVSQRQAQRYMAAAQGKPIPLRAIKNDTVSHLPDAPPPEIVIPLGSVGEAEWEDSQGNQFTFEVHSFLFPGGETLGIRSFYMVAGPGENSGAYCEYDKRGINASFCGVREKAKEHYVPLEKMIVFEGEPVMWNSMHEMDVSDLAKKYSTGAAS